MKRYLFFLLPLVSVLTIVLTTALFTLPKIKSTIDIKEKLGEEKEKLSRLTDKVTLLEGLDEYELEKKVATAEKTLPSKKAVMEVLAALSSLSAESELSFVGFDILPGRFFPEQFESPPFKATFKGSRDDVKNFLERVGQVVPVMKVIGFAIEGEKATLEMESYFSPLPESLGKIDDPLPEISENEEEIYQKIVKFESFEKILPTVPTGKEDLFF